jgi:hypothetical protein
MRSILVFCALAASFAFPPVLAQTSSAEAASTNARYSTAETEIGTLLDDPAARAVLEKHIPTIAKSESIDMARSLTLRGLQSYSDTLTDALLDAIDADLVNLTAKK